MRSTDLFFPIIEGKRNPYPAQPATGVLGQRPKRILPTFVRTKVGPRRVGVLIKSFIRLAPPEVITNSPPPAGVQIMITKKTCPAAGDYKPSHDRARSTAAATPIPPNCPLHFPPLSAMISCGSRPRPFRAGPLPKNLRCIPTRFRANAARPRMGPYPAGNATRRKRARRITE